MGGLEMCSRGLHARGAFIVQMNILMCVIKMVHRKSFHAAVVFFFHLYIRGKVSFIVRFGAVNFVR